MKFRTTINIAALVLFSSFAQAQTAAEDVQLADEGFAKMDGNNDGNITRAEFGSFMTVYLAQQREQFDTSFRELDGDNDGKLSLEEAAANTALEGNFDQIDTDEDGALTKLELQNAMAAAQAKALPR